jgi:hypothetical protein
VEAGGGGFLEHVVLLRAKCVTARPGPSPLAGGMVFRFCRLIFGARHGQPEQSAGHPRCCR